MKWLFSLVVLAVLGLAGCVEDPQEQTLVPGLTVTPVEGFVPSVGAQGVIEYRPATENSGPQGDYLEGSSVISIPETDAHIKLRVTNTLDVDIGEVVINMYVNDPTKVVIFKVSGWAYLGIGWFQGAPAPAMIDETRQLFENDPYKGYMVYTPTKALAAGESYEFEVFAGGAAGLMMHFEAAAPMDETDQVWAVPVPRSGTTLVLTEATSESRQAPKWNRESVETTSIWRQHN